jgi:hypothetical protein
MGKGNKHREARDHKYTEIVVVQPKRMVGIHGWHRDVFPDMKPTRHGQMPDKPEREDRWQ